MKQKHPARILFVSQNPGGFQAIFPVYKKLRRDPGFFVSSIFSEEAESVSADKSVSFVPIKRSTKKFVENIFSKFDPDLLVFGTSAGLSIDKFAVLAARSRRIPQVAVLDFWSNYKMRFSDPGTENLRYLPDWILVMDEFARRQMVQEGFPSKKIVVTGNPYFDTFARVKKIKLPEERIISFFDQPLSEVSSRKEKRGVHLDERKLFQDIVGALEMTCSKAKVIIKFHPRTKDKGKYRGIIKNSALDIRIRKKESAEDLAARSWLVLGINSMVLFYAAMMGKSVLSYQPGYAACDPLVSNKLGLSVGVYQKKDLLQKLKAILQKNFLKKNQKIIDAYLENHSTKKVIRFLRSLVA